jgi:hypothetical protein
LNKNGIPSYSVNDSKIITMDSNKLAKFSPIQIEAPKPAKKELVEIPASEIFTNVKIDYGSR